MDSLLGKIFSKSQVAPGIQLLNSEETRSMMIREIGNKLIESPLILPDPMDQLLAITSLADFAEEDECLQMVGIIYRHMGDIDVLPAISKHQGKELAERCLLGLSFFQQEMQRRNLRHGAPSPEYYRKVGQYGFKSIGLIEISDHFENWEVFLSERLT